MKPILRRLLPGLLLLALLVMGVGVRRYILNAQRPGPAGLPFTLESAIEFARIRTVMETGALPERDRLIEYPAGVETRASDTVFSVPVYAVLAGWLPSSWPLEERVRWLHAVWFCLGIPLLFAWVAAMTGSKAGGFWAAAFYAVAIAAVGRSTGQELSHENNALPLLLGHLLLDALAAKSRRFQLPWAVASAVALVLALLCWDMIQFYVLLWAVAWYARAAWSGTPAWSWRWGAPLAGMVGLGLGSAYYRAHGFLFSPAMLLAYGVTGLMLLRTKTRRGHWLAVCAALIPLALGLLVPTAYKAAYGHFAALLAAKIRFLNHRPWDPALLTFEQRIMWVPALHSTTWALAFDWFPAILLLTIPAIWCVMQSGDSQWRSSAGINQLVFFNIASLGAFILFFRFHVFLVVFSVALLGGWAAWAMRKGSLIRAVAHVLLAAGWVLEAFHAVEDPLRWGRTNMYYPELRELTGWLAAYAAPEPVLANFGVSSSVAAYGHCPVLLHPKFEAPGAREQVRQYAERLFAGSEQELRDWALARGAAYYVHSIGELSPVGREYQMRYMVNCLDPATNAPVRLFEERPDALREFRLLWGNRKYRVFRILPPRDPVRAEALAQEALAAFQQGDLRIAEKRALRALEYHADNDQAQQVLRLVMALRAQDFGETPAGAPPP